MFNDRFRDAKRAFENENWNDRRRRKKDQKREKVYFEMHWMQIYRQDFNKGKKKIIFIKILINFGQKWLKIINFNALLIVLDRLRTCIYWLWFLRRR